MKADKTCILFVKDGKIWCETHQTFEHETGIWEDHENHHNRIERVAFRHVLYTGSVCMKCNDGKILIDEEQ